MPVLDTFLDILQLDMIEGELGVFYGLSAKGGLYDRGGIWKFDTNGVGYRQVGNFNALAGGTVRNP